MAQATTIKNMTSNSLMGSIVSETGRVIGGVAAIVVGLLVFCTVMAVYAVIGMALGLGTGTAGGGALAIVWLFISMWVTKVVAGGCWDAWTAGRADGS